MAKTVGSQDPAVRGARRGRSRRSGLAVVIAAAACGLVVASGLPAFAVPVYPSSQDVANSRAHEASAAQGVGQMEAALTLAESRLEALDVRVAKAVERYNGARAKLAVARTASAAAEKRAALARIRLERTRLAVGRLAVAAYRSGGDVAALGAVLSADGPQAIIDRAATLDLVSSQQNDLFDSLRVNGTIADLMDRRASAALRHQRVAARAVRAAKNRAEAEVTAQRAEVANISASRDTLVRELAAARNTTVTLERQREQGLAAEAAARQQAQARAAARQAAQRQAAKLAHQQAQRRAARRAAAEAATTPARQSAAEPSIAPAHHRSHRSLAPPTPATPTRTHHRHHHQTPAPDPEPAPDPAPEPAPAPPPSGGSSGSSSGAERAIAYAEAQIGDPYQWGADGPDTFDCSGLTMMAWAQGGVSLPHYSVWQYAQSEKVSLSNLRRGDLVFFASDPGNYLTIYHVALYIGGGNMIEAPYTGANVRISSIYRSSLFGAARP